MPTLYLHFVYTLSKSPIHLSFNHIYHFDMLSLAVSRTLASYKNKNLVHGLAHHESPIAQWLERPTSIWRVMGSTPVGVSENSFSGYEYNLLLLPETGKGFNLLAATLQLEHSYLMIFELLLDVIITWTNLALLLNPGLCHFKPDVHPLQVLFKK